MPQLLPPSKAVSTAIILGCVASSWGWMVRPCAPTFTSSPRPSRLVRHPRMSDGKRLGSNL